MLLSIKSYIILHGMVGVNGHFNFYQSVLFPLIEISICLTNSVKAVYNIDSYIIARGNLGVKGLSWDKFQDTVADCLIRHKSILDVLTKFQETTARVNRAVSKSVTNCGCIQINAKKQQVPSEIRLYELVSYMDTHTKGELCDNCREIIELEIGNHLFYLAALCNILELNLEDILCAENEKLSTLGIYNLS